MSKSPNINSTDYWDSRFSTDWEIASGPEQSRFFALLALANLPSWLIQVIKTQTLTVVDWGCAQGDGTNVWASYIEPGQLAGVDFSGTAIKQAEKKVEQIKQDLHEKINSDVLAKIDSLFLELDADARQKCIQRLQSLVGTVK